MPRRVDYRTQRDFTGGLNLARSLTQLDDTESPDLLNVDVDPRGGFGLRRGVEPYLTALAGVAHSLLPFVTSTGTYKALVGLGTALYHHDGTNWVSIFTGGPAGPYRSVTFKDRIYVLSGNNSVRRWDGTTATTLTDPSPANWNNNIAAPTVPPSNGYFPKAKVGAAYQGAVFVGNITEGSTAYPCRVRWSHPLFPEDWASTHYIDIEPEDGDEITALVPMDDRLLVFKHRSIHAVYGAPPTDLSVSPVSRELGCSRQEAAVGTDVGVMFWHEGSGAHLLAKHALQGTKQSWIGERIWPAIEDGRITGGAMDDVTVGWINRRLWCAVPWEGSSTRNRVFVYDPFCGKDGAWTFYDLEVGPFLSLPQAGDAPLCLAASSGTSYVLELEQFDVFTDDYGAGNTHIDSHYTTRWWDQGEPVVKKRWKRPEFVILAGQESQIVVNVLRNYDPTFHFKTFTIGTEAPAGEGVFDVDDWDEGFWAREGGERDEVKRGSPLGNARSVALKFNGPSANLNWRVDALTMKWISKRVRN
jgi:hypothetical protein